jgi:hypothetical protein
VSEIVYDSGALIAADRNDRAFWADHRVRLERGLVPVAPAPVVAQVSRSPRQVQLRRLLRGCRVLALDEAGAHGAGYLLGRAGTADVVDAHVVIVAMNSGAAVLSSDRSDLERLAVAAGVPLRVVEV